MALWPTDFDPFLGGSYPGGAFLDPYWAAGDRAGMRRRLAEPPQGACAGDGGAAGETRGERRRHEPYVVGPAGWTRSIPCDFIERGREYVVVADIPGCKKTDIHVDVRPPATPSGGAVLRIGHKPGSEREKEDTEEPGIFHRAERITTFRNRNLRLPEDADRERVQEAIYADGVLTIVIPKKEAAAAHPGARMLEIE